MYQLSIANCNCQTPPYLGVRYFPPFFLALILSLTILRESYKLSRFSFLSFLITISKLRAFFSTDWAELVYKLLPPSPRLPYDQVIIHAWWWSSHDQISICSIPNAVPQATISPGHHTCSMKSMWSYNPLLTYLTFVTTFTSVHNVAKGRRFPSVTNMRTLNCFRHKEPVFPLQTHFIWNIWSDGTVFMKMINPSHDHDFLPDTRSQCSPCKTSAPCLDRFSSFLSREFLGHHFLPPIKSNVHQHHRFRYTSISRTCSVGHSFIL